MYGGLGGCEGAARCTAGEETIGGKPARTLGGERARPDERGRRWFYSVKIPVKPQVSGPMGIDLVAHAQCATAALCERAAAALRTIRFTSAGPVMAKTRAAPQPPQPQAEPEP
jgi:hypothetical protein